MNHDRVNIALTVLLVIAAGFAISMKADLTQPNIEFLPEMKRSPAFSAFAVNSVLPDGRTLQKPVAGTIPRGDLPLYYEKTKEDAVQAGEELQNPVSVEVDESVAALATSKNGEPVLPKVVATSATVEPKPAEPPPDPKAKLHTSIQRGAQTYGVFCVPCHGAKGAGDGPVTKRGFPPPAPLPTGKSVKMKDGQLFHILSYGQGSMSSMAAQLNRNQRWDVINYVRSLQQRAADNQTAAPMARELDQPATVSKTNAPLKSTEAADEAKP